MDHGEDSQSSQSQDRVMEGAGIGDREDDLKLSKLQQIHAHLAAVEQIAASYPKDHSTRLVIESLDLYKARTAVEDDMVRLRRSLGYGTEGYGTL
jgi:hypothetical protein